MSVQANDFIVKEQEIKILLNTKEQHVIDEIRKGLSATQKYISPKFFYDKVGSQLFEEITQLEEYYPTNTEKNIIANVYPKLNIDFRNLNIIELGSGDHAKISLFLNQIPTDILSTISYYPVDISKTAIIRATNNLNLQFPQLSIKGVVADFIHQIPQLTIPGKNIFLFFGSTIGNLLPSEIKAFMEDVSSIMKPGDYLLMGMDLVKDISTLENAYNDKKQITARFNKNVLHVINRLTGSNLDVDKFDHKAFFNKKMSRIEMHLIANTAMTIEFPVLNQIISFKEEETIHTENSHKFSAESMKVMGDLGKLHLDDIFTDDKKWFSLSLYSKPILY